MQGEQAQTGDSYIFNRYIKSSSEFEKLIIKAIEGEMDDLSNLCHAIAKGVLFRASYIMRERMDAEDAAQETLIRVCQGIHKLNEPKAFGAWLDKIIVNEARRVYAKNSTHGSVLSLSDQLDFAAEDIKEDSVDLLPFEFTVREEDRRVVNEIIKTLPNRQREAVLLHYYDGLNVTETASAMETTKGNVSSYLKLAIGRVKDELSGRTGGHEAATYGLGLLPIGPLLSHTMRMDEDAFASGNDEWVKRAISKGAKEMKSKTSSATDRSGFADSWKFAGILIALIAAGAVFLGASHGSANAAFKSPEELVPVAGAYGKVILDGTGDGSYVNPTDAIAQAGTEDGDMAAQYWQITANGSETVLYSGEGGIVSSALRDLREQKKDGEYRLSFHMVDKAGIEYTLYCNFLISADG